jgi:hypothetical protein
MEKAPSIASDDTAPERAEARLGAAAPEFGAHWFTRLAASASRDLAEGVKRRLLSRRGERRLAQHRFRS